MFRATTNPFHHAVGAAFKTDLNQIGIGAFRRRWPTYNIADVVSPHNKRGLFFADVGMGPSNSRTSAYFKRHQLSTDDNAGAMRNLFKAPQTSEMDTNARAAYEKTFEQFHGHPPQAEELRGPWHDFNFANMDDVKNREKPYVHIFRQAVETGLSRMALENSEPRPGEVHFFLNGFDARMYVDSIVMTELAKKITFDEYVANICLPNLIDDDREAELECRAGPPTITNIEVYDASMGEFKKTGEKFKWRAANEAPLDFKTFQNLQEKALSAARTPANKELLQKSGKMTKEAEAAIANLQQYISTGRLPA